MTSLTDIRSWDLRTLDDMLTALHGGVLRIDEVIDQLDRAVDDSAAVTGVGPRAQQLAVADLIRRGRALRNAGHQVADCLEKLNAQLEPLRDHLVRSIDDARAQHVSVTDDGVTFDGPDGDAVDFHRYRVGRALAELQTTDHEGAQRIRQLRDAVDELAGSTTGSTGHSEIMLDELFSASSERRRTLIADLSPVEVTELIASAPEVLGNLDGIPFEIRIEANRIAIANARDDELSREKPDLARLRRYDDMLARDRSFLAFSPAGQGRMIELIGELKPGISGIGVVVPGTGTNLSSSIKTSRSARALSAASRSPVIVYTDGPLPQTLTGQALPSAARGLTLGTPGAVGGFLSGLRGSAADASFAREMAPDLVSFGRELDIELARHAPGTPTTYIGHSYGGAVVGSAEQLGLRADRVVYASSAGIGAFGGDWHNPAADVHRYSLTAPGDPIHLAQELTFPFGGDPDDHAGVRRLDTGTYRDGSAVAGIEGHYRYWDDPDSTAFQNMAAVIAGDPLSDYVDRGADVSLRLK